jgi:hypothetical protein
MPLNPHDVLATAVESYAAHLQPSGELHDPVFGVPTQYGTAYYAYCNAALASCGATSMKETYLDRATRGIDAALAHTADPSAEPTVSRFDGATGAEWRENHRDFTWPAILKTYTLLRDLGSPRAAEFADRIAAVDIEQVFHLRPPTNWAAVWLSGEWIRHREGLSPYDERRLDAWLGEFFATKILLEQGMYLEDGLPNSYDLFTRVHLLDMLDRGYEGAWNDEMRRLLRTGLRRSLDVQLSDGSLASAARSTGQTWTLGAQVAFFTLAARLVAGTDTALAAQARDAATRGFSSLTRWQRPGRTFSPVENVLPAAWRVGYETYTADGHYASLALAFLATAVLAGLTLHDDIPALAPTARIEHEPTHRAIAHHGAVSVHVNTQPAEGYDGYGITDLTFGPGRFLHFASSVRHVGSGALFNLGLACRTEPGRAPLTVLAQHPHARIGPIHRTATGLSVRADTYTLDVDVRSDGVTIEESTPGAIGYRTLLLPYLRDPGTGTATTVTVDGATIRLLHGVEELAITVDGPIEHFLDLSFGYENRRGMCGLLRADVGGRRSGLRYQVHIVR